jgi:hypothetical protein
MPLESATFISDLVSTNPAHTDGINQTDAHCRIIKQTLLTTFPAITGTVTASHVDLNTTTGMAATLTSLGSAAVKNTGAQSMSGPLTVTTSVNSASIQKNGSELLPTGVIAMWSGIATNVPAGWQICDGTGGTPNLIGMFIAGAGSGGPAPGQTGGQNIQAINTSTVAAHSHTGVTAAGGVHTHTGSSDAQGSHSHTGASGAYALTINDMPNHDHGQGGLNICHAYPGTGGGGGSFLTLTTFQAQGGNAAHSHAISADGLHSHSITNSTDPGHQHALSSDGSHNHVVYLDVRPTYYALCFIMKL